MNKECSISLIECIYFSWDNVDIESMVLSNYHFLASMFIRPIYIYIYIYIYTQTHIFFFLTLITCGTKAKVWDTKWELNSYVMVCNHCTMLYIYIYIYTHTQNWREFLSSQKIPKWFNVEQPNSVYIFIGLKENLWNKTFLSLIIKADIYSCEISNKQ